MWDIEGKIYYTSKQVLDFIASNPHAALIMSGPSCGKSSLLKNSDLNKKKIVSSEKLSSFCYGLIRYHPISEINSILSNIFDRYDYLIIEDIDMCCGTFNLIDHYITDFISEYINDHTLIFTGMDIHKWGVFWEMYHKNKAIVFVTYIEEYED